MALVSNPNRCYYNGLSYSNNNNNNNINNAKNSSLNNLHNNPNNNANNLNSTNFNNDAYSSSAKSLAPPACSAPSIQTTFARPTTTNGNSADDSAGPSSTSSSSSLTTASCESSSLLAAPAPRQADRSGGRAHHGAHHAHQRYDVAGVVVNGGGGNQSSSGCSSSSPVGVDGADGGAAPNTHPDKPIGYGAFGVVWSVTDPRSGKQVALKKMPNVFQNLASCKRVFREIRMLSSFKHDNILSCLDILQPTNPHLFQEIYVITELMQSDLHKIIVSPQPLSTDHIKVFLYQILRGVKYLQSANIIHRDIKPGNLLVNSNCVLKICDFGLARMWDPTDQGHMTHEVVTQYYRAPELLMGARRYTTSVDVWSIGCIFAEMLGRRILFQAQGPIDQLNMIIDLLGTPTISQMKYACDGARCHVLKSGYRSPNAAKLYTLSSQATHDAVHLLTQMLAFDPDQRITVEEALAYPYVDEGRLRFHSCMCSCCYTSRDGTRVYGAQTESCHADPFDPRWEKDLCRYSMYDLRDRIYKFVADRPSLYNVPLCINPHSAAYKSFTSSNCAQFNEMPPSPQVWE